MKQIISLTFFAALATAASTSYAEEQTVKLSVPDMSCASCPYMIEQAISAVAGIKLVEATMGDRSATVIFENTLTNVEEIKQATNDIGYLSTVIALN